MKKKAVGILFLASFLFVILESLFEPDDAEQPQEIEVRATRIDSAEELPASREAEVQSENPVETQLKGRALMEADLSGVWSLGQGKGYVYFYPDGEMKWLASDCGVRALGRWKYEFGSISLTQGGREVLSTNVIKLPSKLTLGSFLTLDTTRKWMFLGTDLDMEC